MVKFHRKGAKDAEIFFLSGFSPENKKQSNLCVLCVFAVNKYISSKNQILI